MPRREPELLPRADLTRAAVSPISPRSTMPASAPASPASPVKRIGRDRFVRNVLIAIGNAPSPAASSLPPPGAGSTMPSPLVRGAAVWAFGRIAGAADLAAEASARLNRETDATVRDEWQLLGPYIRPRFQQDPTT